MKELFSLLISFFKIGLFTFGGGYSMLPMLQKEIVEKRGWATEGEILDYFAVSQCAPGAIAVNTAIFVGYRKKKIPGALMSALGIVLPSLIIITIIAALLGNFAHLPAVKSAFAGIRIAACALIISSLIKLIKANVRSAVQIVLAVLSFIIVAVLGQNPIFVVLGAALFGLFTAGRVKADA
ncbi:MAG: chromate transporter [Clostridiales bacterium]|nr:chromate transporter [Clostridiales bacterium]